MQIAFRKPFFKTNSIPKAHEDALTKAWSNNSILNQISKQIKALDTPMQKTASCLDKTCLIAATESSSSEDDAEEQNDSEEDTLNVIYNTFEDDAPLPINKIR